MNIPLSAFSNYSTVNRMTGEQQIIIWKDGEKKVVSSPRDRLCVTMPRVALAWQEHAEGRVK